MAGSDMVKFFQSPDFSDLTIVTLDAQIKVHRLVVAGTSPVIRKALTVPLQERETSEFNMEAFETIMVKRFLRYCYTKVMNLDDEDGWSEVETLTYKEDDSVHEETHNSSEGFEATVSVEMERKIGSNETLTDLENSESHGDERREEYHDSQDEEHQSQHQNEEQGSALQEPEKRGSEQKAPDQSASGEALTTDDSAKTHHGILGPSVPKEEGHLIVAAKMNIMASYYGVDDLMETVNDRVKGMLLEESPSMDAITEAVSILQGSTADKEMMELMVGHLVMRRGVDAYLSRFSCYPLFSEIYMRALNSHITQLHNTIFDTDKVLALLQSRLDSAPAKQVAKSRLDRYQLLIHLETAPEKGEVWCCYWYNNQGLFIEQK